jgi:ABC-type Fe3+-hydroxamate transport system substrate-binding protein
MVRLYLFLVLLCLSGCASITGHQTQPVTVFAVCAGSAAPVEAGCVLENDKGRKVVTSPGTVAIERSFSDLSVQCTVGKSKPGRVVLSSKSDGKILGNILAGGLVGAAVDVGTGAAFNYPSRVTILLDCASN